MSVPSTPTVDAVVARLVSLLTEDPSFDEGVVHSACVWDGPHGARVIRVGPHAPKSEDDAFLLHAARARADAIITTGKILRDEPALVYDLGGASGLHDALLAYRELHLGKRERPSVVVLSRGEVDLAHRAFHGWAKPRLFVPDTGRRTLESVAPMHGVDVVRFARLDLAVALDALRAEGARTILVEAGVTTAADYVAAHGVFDELVLTRFEEPTLDARAIGEPFFDRDLLERGYGPPRSVVHRTSPDGRFVFERYRRA